MLDPPEFTLDLTTTADTATAVLCGELDLAEAPRVRTSIERGVPWSDISEVIVDLRDLSFMDSSGLSVFVWLKQRHPAVPMVVRVCPDSIVSRLLDITSMEDLFTIESTNDNERG